MTFLRQPLIIGELNDGLEKIYPSTDVPRIAKYAQVLLLQELTNDLKTQLPGWWTMQGPANMGIAIAPNLMTVESSRFEHMSTWLKKGGRYAAVAQVDYLGRKITFISAHRPTIKATAAQRAQFDQNLANLIKTEHRAGRDVIVGIDANDRTPTNLATLSNTTWHLGGDVVGFLLSGQVHPQGEPVKLAMSGEHFPCVFMVDILTTV